MKKLIGLCISMLGNDKSLEIFNLIHKYAYEKDYRLISYYPEEKLVDYTGEDCIDSLYMMNFSKLYALIVETNSISNVYFVNSLIKKASDNQIPVIILNGFFSNAICLNHKLDNAFEELMKYLTANRSRKNIYCIANKNDKSAYNNFFESNINIYNHIVYINNIKDALNSSLEKIVLSGADAIICASDEIAYSICRNFKENELFQLKDIIVASIGENENFMYGNPFLTKVKKDTDKMCKKAIELLSKSFKGQKLDNIHFIDAELVFNENNDCIINEDFKYINLAERFYYFKGKVLKADLQSSQLAEQLLSVSPIFDISSVLCDGLPKDSFFCVKDSFMQDFFQENAELKKIDLNDKFYVIADNRTNGNTMESFKLAELFPNFNLVIDDKKPVIIMPIHYKKNQYGYIVMNSADYMLDALTLAKYVCSFNSAIGRFVEDRKLNILNSELFHANQNLKHIKERDLLTGMYNSKSFLCELNRLKEFAVKNNEKILLLCIDLEGLGKINDIYGHSEGDVAIQTLASILIDSMDKNDICAHLGSDEFVLAMHTISKKPENIIETFFTALNGRVDNYNYVSANEYSLEINKSYLLLEVSSDLDMKAALDEALGRKQLLKQSRRSVSVANKRNGLNLIGEEEYNIISSVISNNKFKYVFQPIVSVKTGKIIGYEALMRADTEKFISPLAVLKCATIDDRLYEIEYATFFNVLDIISKNENAIGDKKIFVNSIPGFFLSDNDYSKLNRKYGKFFNNIVVEITEQTEMDEENLSIIQSRSKNNQFEVAIDDYGTGYSNTTSLLRYLPNYIKIDRLLISKIQSEPKKQHFVNNIIEFAHDNGFLALAEGVEDVEELNAVIHMGIDLVQGFYTGKPMYEFSDSISHQIEKEIVNASIEGLNCKRKIYVAENKEEIFLMRLALEHYTGILVSQEEVTIIGNEDYSVDIQIKIKDCSKSTIRLRNVNLSSVNENPCIDIGNYSHLTLIVENNNYINGAGIRVPEMSKLAIKGTVNDNLKIFSNFEKSFAIGNDWNNTVGEILLESDGVIDIRTEGSYSVAIGGGSYRYGNGIRITKGIIIINSASANSVCIGAVSDKIPIYIRNCSITENIKAFSCVGIGTWNGEQDVDISKARVEIIESGSSICGIGSVEGMKGKAKINDAHIIINVNGASAYMIGNAAEPFYLEARKVRFDLVGEGNCVLGIGSSNYKAMIDIEDAIVNISIKAAVPIPFGADESNCKFNAVANAIKINDNPV